MIWIFEFTENFLIAKDNANKEKQIKVLSAEKKSAKLKAEFTNNTYEKKWSIPSQLKQHAYDIK